MSGRESFYAEIPEERLLLSVGELSARLGVSGEYRSDLIAECENNLRKVLACRYTAVRLAVSYPGGESIDFGYGAFFSHSLYRNLSRCNEVFIFAATLGFGTDRLLGRLSAVSAAEYFITDALASAFAEAATEYAEKEIKGALKCRPRFSPGYGDCPLSVQSQILSAVNAGRLLNITLSKSQLMSPSKSVTAIMGIYN